MSRSRAAAIFEALVTDITVHPPPVTHHPDGTFVTCGVHPACSGNHARTQSTC